MKAANLPRRDRDGIVLERHVELAPHVLARHERVGPLLVQPEQLRHVRLVVGWARVVPVAEPPIGVLPGTGGPALVHGADERRQPVGVELDQREVEVGVALGDAATDELADHLLRDDRAVDGLGDHAL